MLRKPQLFFIDTPRARALRGETRQESGPTRFHARRPTRGNAASRVALMRSISSRFRPAKNLASQSSYGCRNSASG